MSKVHKRIQYNLFPLILSLCLIVISCLAMTTHSQAAGAGYSDLIKMYDIVGMDKKPELNAMALLYGTANGSDNYAVIYKFKDKDSSSSYLLADVISEEELNKLVNNSLSSTQVDVSNLNEYLLSLGAPESFLSIDEKPYFVRELEKGLSAKKSTITVTNNVFVTPEALQYAAQRGGNNFKIHFDSMIGNKVDVRITVTASQATKGFVTAANSLGSDDHDIVNKFSANYTNKFVPIDFLQDGSFGTNVRVSAKLDLSALNTNSLVFYSYDIFANKYKKLDSPDYSIDSNGYLSFTTSEGGTILITDRVLEKK